MGIEPYLPSEHPLPQRTIPCCTFHPTLPYFLLVLHHFFSLLNSTHSCHRLLETHLLPPTLFLSVHSPTLHGNNCHQICSSKLLSPSKMLTIVGLLFPSAFTNNLANKTFVLKVVSLFKAKKPPQLSPIIFRTSCL